jgi:hypothetical protein
MNRTPPSFRPRLEVLEERWLPSFSAPTHYPVGTNPQAMVTAYLNSDGKLDLITANQGTYSSTTGTFVGGGVSVLLGKSHGTFGSAQNYAVGSCSSVAIGLIDGDGALDIVTSNGSVLLGNGDGTFRAGPTIAGGLGDSLFLRELNHDGKLDLIAASRYGTSVSTLLGNGDGTFQAPKTFALPASLQGMAVEDFNRDGQADLAVTVVTASGTSSYGVSVLQNVGDGTGTFAAARTYTLDGSATSIAVGDFNQDGKLDLVTTGAELNVLLNNGDGTFRAAQKVGPAGSQVVVTDFNGDGYADLAQIDASGAGIDVLLNNADWSGTTGHKGHK